MIPRGHPTSPRPPVLTAVLLVEGAEIDFFYFFFLVEVQECRTCNGRIQFEVVSVLTSVVPHVSASYTALMQAFLCFGLNLLIHKA